jgi:hypothetical protein
MRKISMLCVDIYGAMLSRQPEEKKIFREGKNPDLIDEGAEDYPW